MLINALRKGSGAEFFLRIWWRQRSHSIVECLLLCCLSKQKKKYYYVALGAEEEEQPIALVLRGNRRRLPQNAISHQNAGLLLAGLSCHQKLLSLLPLFLSTSPMPVLYIKWLVAFNGGLGKSYYYTSSFSSRILLVHSFKPRLSNRFNKRTIINSTLSSQKI